MDSSPSGGFAGYGYPAPETHIPGIYGSSNFGPNSALSSAKSRASQFGAPGSTQRPFSGGSGTPGTNDYSPYPPTPQPGEPGWWGYSPYAPPGALGFPNQFPNSSGGMGYNPYHPPPPQQSQQPPQQSQQPRGPPSASALPSKHQPRISLPSVVTQTEEPPLTNLDIIARAAVELSNSPTHQALGERVTDDHDDKIIHQPVGHYPAIDHTSETSEQSPTQRGKPNTRAKVIKRESDSSPTSDNSHSEQLFPSIRMKKGSDEDSPFEPTQEARVRAKKSRKAVSEMSPEERLEYSRMQSRNHSRKSRLRRKEQERQLKEQVEELVVFKSIIEESNQLISIHSPDVKATFLYANPTFARILSYCPSDLSTVGLLSLCHPEDREKLQAMLSQAITTENWKPCQLTWRVKASEDSSDTTSNEATDTQSETSSNRDVEESSRRSSKRRRKNAHGEAMVVPSADLQAPSAAALGLVREDGYVSVMSSLSMGHQGVAMFSHALPAMASASSVPTSQRP